MKKGNTTISVLIALLFCIASCQLQAQNLYKGEIQYKELQVSKGGNLLRIQLQLDLTSIELNNQQMLQLTPVLKSKDRADEYRYAPIIVAGRIRDKVITRQSDLPNDKRLKYVVRRNGKEQLLPVELETLFEAWMYEADLFLEETISGCAECELGKNNYLISNRIVAPKFVPEYQLQYVTPEAEEVKHRSETYAALLNFRVGRYELLRDFENNAAILHDVDKIVSEIRNDDNLTIQEMEVTGYASPEGNYNSNMVLSKNRTFSFVDYLVSAHNIDRALVKTDWKGEDWEGLRKSVSNSPLTERDAVIRIIDQNQDINKRKQQLQAMPGGVYRTLLNEYYPPLRRIEYTFSYIARPFNVNEAKEVMKKKPQHLSLNEMFLVAQTYKEGSPEFDQVFDVAVRLFPESVVANLNVSVQEINQGALNKAIDRLKGLNTPEALNNLGVAYVQKGEYEEAAGCFSKAAAMGNTVAANNEAQLERFLKEQ